MIKDGKETTSGIGKRTVEAYEEINKFDESISLAIRNNKNKFLDEIKENKTPEERLVKKNLVHNKFEFGGGYEGLTADKKYSISNVPSYPSRIFRMKDGKCFANTLLDLFSIPVNPDIFIEMDTDSDEIRIERRFCFKFLNTLYRILDDEITNDDTPNIATIYDKQNKRIKEKGYIIIAELLKELRNELTQSFLEMVDCTLKYILLEREINYSLLFNMAKPSKPMAGQLTCEEIYSKLSHVLNKLNDIENSVRIYETDRVIKTKLNIAEKAYLSLVSILLRRENAVFILVLNTTIEKLLTTIHDKYGALLKDIYKLEDKDEILKTNIIENIPESEDKAQYAKEAKQRIKNGIADNIYLVKTQQKYRNLLTEKLRNTKPRSWYKPFEQAQTLYFLSQGTRTSSIPTKNFFINLIVCEALQSIYKYHESDFMFIPDEETFKANHETRVFSSYNLTPIEETSYFNKLPATNYLHWLETNSAYIEKGKEYGISILDRVCLCVADLLCVFSEIEIFDCLHILYSIILGMGELSHDLYSASNLFEYSWVFAYEVDCEFRYAALATFMTCYHKKLKEYTDLTDKTILKKWAEKLNAATGSSYTIKDMETIVRDLEASTKIDFYYIYGKKRKGQKLSPSFH